MFQKAWFKSKTILFNIASLALLVMALPEFTAVLPAGWVPIIALVNAVGNLWLRTITARPVGVRDIPK